MSDKSWLINATETLGAGLAWCHTTSGGECQSTLGPQGLEEKGLHSRFLPEAGLEIDLSSVPRATPAWKFIT